MIGPEGTDNCHKFVDILGLRTIFPLFMKSPRKIKKVGTTEKEHEGRAQWRSQPPLQVSGEMRETRAALTNCCATEESALRWKGALFFFFICLFSVHGKATQ